MTTSLRLGKCWQGTSTFLLWQAQAFAQNSWKKGYFCIDLHAQQAEIKWLEAKREDLLAQGGIAALMRKYLPQGTCSAIYVEENKDIWIALVGGTAPEPRRGKGEEPPSTPGLWWLHASHIAPPALSLIYNYGSNHSPKPVLFARFSTAGMHTKPKDWEFSWPGEELQNKAKDILPELIGSVEPSPDHGVVVAEEQQPKEKNTAELLPLYQREGRDRLARRRKTLAKSLAKEKSKIDGASKPEDLEAAALNLQLQLQSEDREPEKNIGQQINDSFLAVKKAKRQASFAKERQTSISFALSQLDEDLARIRANTFSAAEVAALLRRHGIGNAGPDARDPNLVAKSADLQISQKFAAFARVFASADGWRILVGKGAHENDQLTKYAKSNDMWFHVVGMPGSHVVIPTSQARGRILSEATKRDAAILALHFSKARKNQGGEVYATFKQNLRKKKGMAAGAWNVERAQSLRITYHATDIERIYTQSGLQSPQLSSLKDDE